MGWISYLAFVHRPHSKECVQSINSATSGIKTLELRVKPGTAGCEAQTLPMCYVVPSRCISLCSNSAGATCGVRQDQRWNEFIDILVIISSDLFTFVLGGIIRIRITFEIYKICHF